MATTKSHFNNLKSKFTGLIAIISLCFTNISFSQNIFPEGFNDESVFFQGWIMGVDFVNDSITYTWRKDGYVTVSKNFGNPTNVIDISEEVQHSSDNGLLGFTHHPDFANNGYVYLYYVVDPYYMLHKDDPDYNPDSTSEKTAAIGRVTRYQIDVNDYSTVIPDSRKILLGTDFDNGIPSLTVSHMGGTILFGADTTLIISTGDGNTIEGTYAGGLPYPAFAYDSAGKVLGIIDEIEDVGGFRSQLTTSLNGKLLRIDPLTGDGAIGNPFYDSLVPSSNESKIYSLGLRNPFRMTIRPGTGSTNKADGFPGDIFIADVGQGSWEEINHVNTKGMNFGWPNYEGLMLNTPYTDLKTENLLYPNPLSDDISFCKEYLTFTELLIQPNKQHIGNWAYDCNPSEQIQPNVPRFFHDRPIIAYGHEEGNTVGRAQMPGFDDEGKAITYELGATETPFNIEPFDGSAPLGLTFYEGNKFPVEYQNALFFSDIFGWIKVAKFDDNYNLIEVEEFFDKAESVTDVRPYSEIKENPFDGCLYYTSLYTAELRRLCFGGNQKPVIEIDTTVHYGTSPLTVTFDASSTYDPNGDSISFKWDFADGTILNDTSSIITHTFSSSNDSAKLFNVLLTVTDSAGAETTQEIIVSINNTPPNVSISSFEDGDLYTISEASELSLEALVTDNEHTADEMDYEWRLLLIHNNHFHEESTHSSKTASVEIAPLGCLPNVTYYYTVELKVTDPAGLSTTVSSSVFPDCSDTVGSNETNTNNDLKVYPNPFKEDVVILGKEISLLNLYDQFGKLLKANISVNPVSSFTVLNLADLNSGIYFLEIEKAGELVKRKIVKL